MTFAPHLFSLKEPPRHWKNYLENEGFVVLCDILDHTDQTDLLETFKREFTTVSPNFNFSNPDTWTIANTPAMFGKGMSVYNGFGQSDFMWKLRTHPNIQKPFKTLFCTDELVTSLDGFSIFVSDKQKSKSWLHIDQHPDNKLYSIQASYNMFPVNGDDAGFVVIPKTHKTFTPQTKNKGDWIVVDQEMFQPEALKLLIPGNCLTIWNSRLIHANTGMSKRNRNVIPERINRFTPYITFLPKSLRTEKIKEARIQAYKDGKATSHWSNKCEIKTYPYGFKKLYESRGFNTIKPTLTEDGKIPEKRMDLL